MSSKQLETRQKVLNKYLENPSSSYSSIARSLKVATSTVNSVIKRIIETVTIERKQGSGGNRIAFDKNSASKILADYKRKPSQSVRDMVLKYGKSKDYIQRLKKKYNLKTFRAVRVPDRNEKQHEKAKNRARKLYFHMLTKNTGCIIMDDETYVKADFKQMPGNAFYVSKIRGGVDNKFKIIRTAKFPKKYLIWEAICTCGRRSRPYVARGTISSQNYINECLEKKLLPFIRSHNDSSIFWPDLAPAHYSNMTMTWYRDNNINIVPKDMNPPNCPELRPIERFWAIVKRNLRKNSTPASSEVNFKLKWKKLKI